MIVLAICRVRGATSCRDTTTESAAAPAVATSGRNSVAAIVLMSQIFCLRAALNKAKRQAPNILERRGNALTGPFNASPDINRMPLLVGFRIFHCAVRVHLHRAPAF